MRKTQLSYYMWVLGCSVARWPVVVGAFSSFSPREDPSVLLHLKAVQFVRCEIGVRCKRKHSEWMLS